MAQHGAQSISPPLHSEDYFCFKLRIIWGAHWDLNASCTIPWSYPAIPWFRSCRGFWGSVNQGHMLCHWVNFYLILPPTQFPLLLPLPPSGKPMFPLPFKFPLFTFSQTAPSKQFPKSRHQNEFKTMGKPNDSDSSEAVTCHCLKEGSGVKDVCMH